MFVQVSTTFWTISNKIAFELRIDLYYLHSSIHFNVNLFQNLKFGITKSGKILSSRRLLKFIPVDFNLKLFLSLENWSFWKLCVQIAVTNRWNRSDRLNVCLFLLKSTNYGLVKWLSFGVLDDIQSIPQFIYLFTHFIIQSFNHLIIYSRTSSLANS